MTAGARRDKLEAQLRILDEARRLIEQQLATADRSAHARDGRPRLRLIRGGKALVLTPVLWGWAQVREHATASAGIAAAGVLAVPTTLGVATPSITPNNPPPRSVMTTPADEQQELHLPPSSLPPRPAVMPTPEPAVDTGTAEAAESEVTPPVTPAPVSAPIPTPTPTVLPLPGPVEDVVDPVEEVVWTKTTALVHCRDVLLVLPTDLRECVRELLAG